ncbi:MAG: radical protein [Clostridia bacterium]|jgi:TatD family-associated radical SAM protein|nr:radical protein [Clostridia bacterium]
MNDNFSIVYEFENGLYVNMTNRCTNACTFCIRNNGNCVGNSKSLWLEEEPKREEIWEEIKSKKIENYKELVFCGYGEPLLRLNDVLYICEKMKGYSDIPIRINTNGQVEYINKRPVAHQFEGLVDCVSISLNAPNAKKYNELCKPELDGVYEAILSFALHCKDYVPTVIFTVIGDFLTPEEIQKCRTIAEDEIGVQFRVRKFIK